MFFWSMAALLTFAASLSVLLPLSRGGRGAGAGGHDVEVYRDQLAELDRDAGRGLIRAAEAEEARAEIARRILKADAVDRAAAGMLRRGGFSRTVGALAVLAVPLLSWGLYSALGSPDLPSQPLAERLAKNPADSSVDELIARAEGHLAANPSDGRGWEVLAPIYLRLGRFDESVNAYRNAIDLSGATAEAEAGLGEAIAAQAGMVSAEAHAAFERALQLDPAQPKALYYLATGLAQEGRMDEALGAWQAMLAKLPPDSPWREATTQAIAEAQGRLGGSAAVAAAPGPSQDEIDAAAGMSATDRSAMIEQMVASLDERLKQNPRDVEGWMRLVRSYVVLGRADAARDALKRATSALGAGSEDARKVAEFSATLGLTATD